ncbi:MAG: nitroreductase/quinone reductase family protein [Haloarculaceae archaeon]
MAGERLEPSWWQRQMQRVAASRPGSWLFSQGLHHVDRVLLAASGGRASMPGVLAGLPVVRLTTTGAKTGRERTHPVLGLPDGEKWVLVASNWGQDHHPAWYHNLRANPAVELTHEDETDEYVAREATGQERTDYWDRVTDLYVGFEPYQRRSGDRDIPVVVLEPAAD